MGHNKLTAPGAALAACASACVDVGGAVGNSSAPRPAPPPPRATPVLGSIENLFAAGDQQGGLASPVCKKQRCLALPAAPAPLDAAELFAQARALLRQPPCSPGEPPLGRERQSQELSDALGAFAAGSGAGSALYVSGLPGTGKSHTVRKLLQQLCADASGAQQADGGICVTWINCMAVACAGEVHSAIAASLAAGSSSSFGPAACQEQQEQQQQQAVATPPAKGSAGGSSGGGSSDGSCDSDDDDEAAARDQAEQPVQRQQQQQQQLSYEQLLQRLRVAAPSSSGASKQLGRRGYTAARPQPCSASPPPSQASASGAAAQAQESSRPAKRGRAAASLAAAAAAAASGSSCGTGGGARHVVVLDEVDRLAKRRVEDLVQLFLLPRDAAASGVPLLLLGIANSIDLTERALPQLKLAAASPTLLTFPAYTAAQLGAILGAAVARLPCKLFEQPALDLCARSVASSSGDLRHALKACRAALDDLQQQHSQAAAPAPAAGGGAPTVSMRLMAAALSRLASVRSSQFGAQAASSIRGLPNQQQLLLYALSVLCAPRPPAEPDAAAGATGRPGGTPAAAARKPGAKAATASLWKAAGSASAGSPAGGGSASGSGSPGQAAFVLAAGLDATLVQYKKVCALLKLPPCSRTELQHMAELLAQMALIDITRGPAPAGGSGGKPAAKALAARGGGGSKLGGLGGGRRGLLGGGGAKAAAAGGSPARQGELRLSLRASADEVAAALRHNPALRCLVSAGTAVCGGRG